MNRHNPAHWETRLLMPHPLAVAVCRAYRIRPPWPLVAQVPRRGHP